MSTPDNRRRRRASRACDFCHARGLKCRRREAYGAGDAIKASCLTCIDYDARCTMDRPLRKRGRKPASPQIRPSNAQALEVRPQSGWHAHDDGFKSLHTVRRLLRIYCDTMYQCYFPFLSETDLFTRWTDALPDETGPSYMLLMALCAVSSQIASFDAVFDHDLLDDLSVPDSELYYYEVVSKIPVRIVQSDDLDYLRAFGLLAVYSLQRGNHPDLHRYLGMYHALVAQHGFHDESRWPESLSIDAVDDRRRLFWCVYRLEVHSACVLNHVVRMPESQVSVLYPRITPAMRTETQAWTAGWDYITDLFRLMEYAMFSLRGSKNRKASLSVFCERPSPTTLLDGLARLRNSKPGILSRLGQTDGGIESNRCRYMSVQITCTESLVNIMALLYCQAPAREIMDIAEIFLEEVDKASLIMYKVAGSQIVHDLLGVGHMLYNASRYENGRCWAEAKRLIELLGDLVKNLEHHVPSAAEAGNRLLRLADADER